MRRCDSWFGGGEGMNIQDIEQEDLQEHDDKTTEDDHHHFATLRSVFKERFGFLDFFDFFDFFFFVTLLLYGEFWSRGSRGANMIREGWVVAIGLGEYAPADMANAFHRCWTSVARLQPPSQSKSSFAPRSKQKNEAAQGNRN